MNPISSALAAGVAMPRIINYLGRINPRLASGLSTAITAGVSARQLANYLEEPVSEDNENDESDPYGRAAKAHSKTTSDPRSRMTSRLFKLMKVGGSIGAGIGAGYVASNFLQNPATAATPAPELAPTAINEKAYNAIMKVNPKRFENLYGNVVRGDIRLGEAAGILRSLNPDKNYVKNLEKEFGKSHTEIVKDAMEYHYNLLKNQFPSQTSSQKPTPAVPVSPQQASQPVSPVTGQAPINTPPIAATPLAIADQTGTPNLQIADQSIPPERPTSIGYKKPLGIDDQSQRLAITDQQGMGIDPSEKAAYNALINSDKGNAFKQLLNSNKKQSEIARNLKNSIKGSNRYSLEKKLGQPIDDIIAGALNHHSKISSGIADTPTIPPPPPEEPLQPPPPEPISTEGVLVGRAYTDPIEDIPTIYAGGPEEAKRLAGPRDKKQIGYDEKQQIGYQPPTAKDPDIERRQAEYNKLIKKSYDVVRHSELGKKIDELIKDPEMDADTISSIIRTNFKEKTIQSIESELGMPLKEIISQVKQHQSSIEGEVVKPPPSTPIAKEPTSSTPIVKEPTPSKSIAKEPVTERPAPPPKRPALPPAIEQPVPEAVKPAEEPKSQAALQQPDAVKPSSEAVKPETESTAKPVVGDKVITPSGLGVVKKELPNDKLHVEVDGKAKKFDSDEVVHGEDDYVNAVLNEQEKAPKAIRSAPFDLITHVELKLGDTVLPILLASFNTAKPTLYPYASKALVEKHFGKKPLAKTSGDNGFSTWEIGTATNMGGSFASFRKEYESLYGKATHTNMDVIYDRFGLHKKIVAAHHAKKKKEGKV